MAESTTFTDFVGSLSKNQAATDELQRLADYSAEKISVGEQTGPQFDSFDAFRRS